MSTKHYKNFIDNQWLDAAEKIAIENPATTEILGTIARASQQDVDSAVKAARDCVERRELIDATPTQRARWLHAISASIRTRIDEGAHLLSQENGKALNDAAGEMTEAADYFEYYAGMADKMEGKSIPLGPNYMDFTVYEPHGVSIHIIPWNFPVSLLARSLAPALASGNSVVAKSPEICPLASTFIAQACLDAGLPSGAFNLLCGYGSQTGAALVSHQDIDHIVFTGSVPTGKAIMHAAAERAIPCVMELGGKSPAVVFEDADLDNLVNSVRWGIFFNAGQVCSAMSRMLVERSIYEQVIERICTLVDNISVGPGLDNNILTPVVTKAQHQRVLAMCAEAKEQGAVCHRGGAAAQDLSGYFVEPTIFSEVYPEMDLFGNEVFGPVLSITPFDTEEEAWRLANETDYGLVAGIFTSNIHRAMRGAKLLVAGQVFVNEWFAGGVQTPFGGFKRSGYGREKGLEALYTYVRTKNVAIRILDD